MKKTDVKHDIEKLAEAQARGERVDEPGVKVEQPDAPGTERRLDQRISKGSGTGSPATG